MLSKTVLKYFLVVFFLLTHPLFAIINPTLEIRGAAFFPASERFTDIYSDECGLIAIEATTGLPFCTCLPFCIDGWANLDWLSRCGSSIGGGNFTKVSITTFSFGLKFPYPIHPRFLPYIGIGPAFSGVWLRNKSTFYEDKVCKGAVGGVLKSGFYYFITCNIFVDVFVDYIYEKIHFADTHVNLGGVKAGGGVGYRF